jgi:hypothetical protein
VEPSMSVNRNVTVPDGRTPPEPMPEYPTVTAHPEPPASDRGTPHERFRRCRCLDRRSVIASQLTVVNRTACR